MKGLIAVYMILSSQRVVLLDDLGLVGQKSYTRPPDPPSPAGRRLQGSQESNPSADRGSSQGGYRSEPGSNRMQRAEKFDLNRAIKSYLEKMGGKEQARPRVDIDKTSGQGGVAQEITAAKPKGNLWDEFPGSQGRGGELGSPYGGRDKQGSFENAVNPSTVDIGKPYQSTVNAGRGSPERRREGLPEDPRAGYREDSGLNTPINRGGAGQGSIKKPNRLYDRSNGGTESSGRDYRSGHTGNTEDMKEISDFERNARENIENANSAQSSYLEVKIRESKEHEDKIAEDIEKVDEKIERLSGSLSEARAKAQELQIELLNRRNSIKNLISREESDEKLVKRLKAEMRVINNEVVKLSKELDEKKMRLEGLNEDLAMHDNRMKNIKDELDSRRSEVENKELRKSDMNKDIMRIENAITKLKGDREGLMKERSRESGTQARLQNEKDKLGEASMLG